MGAQQPAASLISVKDVVKRFPVGDTEITILKGISFEMHPGEFVSIVGPSGNGKSTLLNMINRTPLQPVLSNADPRRTLFSRAREGGRLLGALASLVPAHNATQISVRQSLAYD